MLLALAAASWLPGGLVAAPSVALGAPEPDSDLLYVQPAPGIAADTLVAALTGLGFDVEPATPRAPGARIRVGAGEAPEALAARLAATRLVRSVEADAVVRATQLPPDSETPEPDDPLYLDGQRAYLGAIGAPEAWAALEARESTGHVLIAVIDTGIDYDHPDLVPRLAVNLNDEFFDGVDNDRSGCPDDILGCNFVSLTTADPSCGYTAEPPNWRTRDDEGHGTFVSGIAAAAGNNEVGVTGVAPGAMLLPVKVLDCTATGRISDAAAGIRYAADMGADVINISFGTPNDSPALREAIEYAQARGAVIVASAGNDGSRGITFPAAYPGVLAVAASGEVDAAGTLDFRLTAPFAHFGEGVDYLAPGVDLLSTFPARLCGAGEWDCVELEYARGTGSSFATPIVAGAVANMLAAYPERSVEFVLTILLTSRHEGVPGQLSRLLDIGAAVQRELFEAGAPGTSRDGGGIPSGPAVE
ncbi:MAG: S8 family serine peptidase [Dehalococcoidia bacterium]